MNYTENDVIKYNKRDAIIQTVIKKTFYIIKYEDNNELDIIEHSK